MNNDIILAALAMYAEHTSRFAGSEKQQEDIYKTRQAVLDIQRKGGIWTNEETEIAWIDLVDAVRYDDDGATYPAMQSLADAIEAEASLFVGDEAGGCGDINGSCAIFAELALNRVNWLEIAEAVRAQYPHLVANDN
jgi:hypothetical protein